MNVGIIGTGYVGTALAVFFENEKKHTIYVYDKNKREFDFYEDKIYSYYTKGKGYIIFAKDINEIMGRCDLVFICVGTPLNSSGHNVSLFAVNEVFEEIDNCTIHKEILRTIVLRSTVPITTTRLMAHKLRHNNTDVIFQPEFLREGSAI